MSTVMRILKLVCLYVLLSWVSSGWRHPAVISLLALNSLFFSFTILAKEVVCLSLQTLIITYRRLHKCTTQIISCTSLNICFVWAFYTFQVTDKKYSLRPGNVNKIGSIFIFLNIKLKKLTSCFKIDISVYIYNTWVHFAI